MSARAERLTAELDEAGVDLLLVTNLINVRYLTGYTGSNGAALVGVGTRAFATDFRYVEQAAEQVEPTYARLIAGVDNPSHDLPTVLTAAALPDGDLKVGFEQDHTSYAAYGKLRELMPERIELVGLSGIVEKLRRVKDAGEIEKITAATKIADEALEALLAGGIVGKTERELALALEHDMRLRGASGPSFDSIVASGAHGALPHAVPRDVKIEKGQLVTFDWGAIYDGYCSDCTRTVAAGEPGPREREAYELVLGAQMIGVAEICAGGDGKAIDRAVRDVIDGAGHKEHFGHGLGHGVGLEIHEAPNLSPRSTDTLLPGDVVTVEPGVYVPGEFGLRIEDLIVVQESGTKILTSIPKALRIVD
jgi:Xaa-Pro aminopeptidase